MKATIEYFPRARWSNGTWEPAVVRIETAWDRWIYLNPSTKKVTRA